MGHTKRVQNFALVSQNAQFGSKWGIRTTLAISSENGNRHTFSDNTTIHNLWYANRTAMALLLANDEEAIIIVKAVGCSAIHRQSKKSGTTGVLGNPIELRNEGGPPSATRR